MTTDTPDPTTPFDFTCLLSELLEDFLLYSDQEQSQWLIDIAHNITLQGRITDVCDPVMKRGSLKVWDVAGQM